MKTLNLFQFAFFQRYDQSIKFLAENLADDEPWEFSSTQVNKYSILKNYLHHTYLRLQSENKICFTPDNKFAAFNTGLVTSNLEDIFAFFEEYKNPNRTDSSPFFFKAFVKKSDSIFLSHFSSNIPDIADYFEKPDDLIFNPKHELIADIDHIIQDNIDRFPTYIRRDGDSEIRRKLMGAIDEVKMRVRTNYKIAVPQYYRGRIQLLLPLCLTAGSPNPDLALVVHRLNENAYTARTCLTLRMAYNNARLIVKPQSSWLKP